MSKRRNRPGKSSPDCNTDRQRSHSSPVKAQRKAGNPPKRRRLFPKPGYHFYVTLMPYIYVDIAVQQPKFFFHGNHKKRLATDLIVALSQEKNPRLYNSVMSHKMLTNDDAKQLLQSHKHYQQFLEYETTVQQLLRSRLANAINDLNQAINQHNKNDKKQSDVKDDTSDMFAKLNARLSTLENLFANNNGTNINNQTNDTNNNTNSEKHNNSNKNSNTNTSSTSLRCNINNNGNNCNKSLDNNDNTNNSNKNDDNGNHNDGDTAITTEQKTMEVDSVSSFACFIFCLYVCARILTFCLFCLTIQPKKNDGCSMDEILALKEKLAASQALVKQLKNQNNALEETIHTLNMKCVRLQGIINDSTSQDAQRRNKTKQQGIRRLSGKSRSTTPARNHTSTNASTQSRDKQDLEKFMNDKKWSQKRQENAIYNYGKYNESIRNKNVSLLTPVFAKKHNDQVRAYERHPKKLLNDRLTQIEESLSYKKMREIRKESLYNQRMEYNDNNERVRGRSKSQKDRKKTDLNTYKTSAAFGPETAIMQVSNAYRKDNPDFFEFETVGELGVIVKLKQYLPAMMNKCLSKPATHGYTCMHEMDPPFQGPLQENSNSFQNEMNHLKFGLFFDGKDIENTADNAVTLVYGKPLNFYSMKVAKSRKVLWKLGCVDLADTDRTWRETIDYMIDIIEEYCEDDIRLSNGQTATWGGIAMICDGHARERLTGSLGCGSDCPLVDVVRRREITEEEKKEIENRIENTNWEEKESVSGWVVSVGDKIYFDRAIYIGDISDAAKLKDCLHSENTSEEHLTLIDEQYAKNVRLQCKIESKWKHICSKHPRWTSKRKIEEKKAICKRRGLPWWEDPLRYSFGGEGLHKKLRNTEQCASRPTNQHRQKHKMTVKRVVPMLQDMQKEEGLKVPATDLLKRYDPPNGIAKPTINQSVKCSMIGRIVDKFWRDAEKTIPIYLKHIDKNNESMRNDTLCMGSSMRSENELLAISVSSDWGDKEIGNAKIKRYQEVAYRNRNMVYRVIPQWGNYYYFIESHFGTGMRLQKRFEEGDGRGLSEYTAQSMESCHLVAVDASRHTNKGKNGSSPYAQILSLMIEGDLLRLDLERLHLYKVDHEQKGIKLEYRDENWVAMIDTLENDDKKKMNQLYNYSTFDNLDESIKRHKQESKSLKDLRKEQAARSAKNKRAKLPDVIEMVEYDSD